MLLAGAPKDRDGGICESPLPYPKHACVGNWTLTLPPGESLRRVDWAAAGLGQFRNPVSGADFSSPLRHNVWVLCVRAWTVRVSVGLVWLVSFVFHCWVKKRRCLFGFVARSLDYR